MPESDLFFQIKSLETEQRNPASENIDLMSTGEILECINNEDALVHLAVRKEIPNITLAVDKIAGAFRNNGRLFYVGAGTSGRLGIVDASECPPTFGSEPQMVQGIIAGGSEAVFRAQEGAEDSEEKGGEVIDLYKINKNDVLCGIAASGRTPFVKGALKKASESGIFTILVTTVPKHRAIELGMLADVMICPEVGPEVITGSTRMKSGTAQKLVLNMLTTASMIRIGKTYGNVMIDLQMTNNKLKERAKKILMEITGIDYDRAAELLNESNGSVKTAIVMQLGNLTRSEAETALEKADGFIKIALKSCKK